MFGFMKFYRCSGNQDERKQYRWHYCGVCKTLGTLYGQASRLFLNRDLVFLSELLAELGGQDANPAAWQCTALRKRNCFALPRKHDEIPLPLRIAATYNVLLAKYKLDDNIADSKKGASLVWKIGREVFSRAFAKAEQQMRAWDFPVQDLAWWMQEQRTRETNPYTTGEPEAQLWSLAEPTAVSTGLGMKYGAILVDRADMADTMYEFGYSFGQLIYLLDALEDFDKDAEKGEFNALRSSYQLSDAHLPTQYREKILRLITSREAMLQQALSDLDMPEEKTRLFNTRITQNLNRACGKEICLRHKTCDVANETLRKMNVREKWNYALATGRKIVHASTNISLLAKLNAHITFAAVAFCIFATPHKALAHVVNTLQTGATSSDSGPECVNLTMLITLWLSVLVGMAGRERSLEIKLTPKSLEGMRDEGVPEEILEKARSLIELEYSDEESFVQALEEVIGPEKLRPYRLKFLKHAEYSKSRRRWKSSGNPDTRKSSLPDCCGCCDCCDCCYLADCGDCDGPDCDCGDCSGCDCGDCDCGGCDCDCGGCDCG